jgi:hypothetical protein
MSGTASRRDNADRSLARSAWESVIPKSRPVGCAHRFDDWSDKLQKIKLTKFVLYYLRPTITLPTRLAVAKAVQLIKAGSSAWIHQTFPNLRNFAWQQGYGAFSVGISQVEETVHYIEQQLEHHRTRTFQEEYLAFLKKHGAHFEEKYLWD